MINTKLTRKAMNIDGLGENIIAEDRKKISSLEKKLEKEGIAVAGRAQVGPTIGSHVGPEAYGVIFVRKKKLEVKIFE